MGGVTAPLRSTPAVTAPPAPPPIAASSIAASSGATPSVTTLSSVVPARDRTIPVDEPLGSMLPDGGLQRGRVVGCEGPAAVTLACGLVAGAVRSGSWLLLLGVPMVGLEALAELGVPLQRVVAVDADGSPAAWAERLAAAADGFELVVTRPPRGAERVERKVRQRLQARGTVLVSIGATGSSIGCDLVFTTASPRWAGIGRGHGRLLAREAEVGLAGRRAPRGAERTLLLPGPDGRVGERTESGRAPGVVLERAG